MENKIGYVTLSEAKEFIEKRFEPIDDDSLSKALYIAFDKIENIPVRCPGEVTTFPRKNDNARVMSLVKKAQILEAYSVATGEADDLSKINQGISGRSIGDMSVSYDKSLKIGDIAFSNVEAARIMKRFSRRTF